MRSFIVFFAVLASTSISFAQGALPTEDQLREKIQRDLAKMSCAETALQFSQDTAPRISNLLNTKDKQIEKNLAAVVVEEVSERLVNCLRGE